MNPEQVTAAFMAAENTIKQYELEHAEILIPSINQLRYAGFHLAKSVEDKLPEEERNRQLVRAYNHCIRARKNAYEAQIIYFLNQIDELSKMVEPSFHNAKSIVPDTVDCIKQAQAIKNEFLHRNHLEGVPIEKFERYYDQLSQIQQKLYALSPIAKSALAEERLKRISKTRSFIAVVVGVVSLGVALASFFMKGSQ